MRITNQDAEVAIESGNLRLELGAGGASVKKDFLSVDVRDLPGVDVVCDLNQELTLFKDSSVAEIYTRHTLEHVENFIGFMHELHRICTSSSKIVVVVPHYSNPFGYSDPTHHGFFGYYTMSYFQPCNLQGRRKVPNYYPDIPFAVSEVQIRFYPDGILGSLGARIKEKCVNHSDATKQLYERRFSWVFPAWEIEYCMSPIK